MRLQPDAIHLIQHATTRLTTRLLREGELVDPAGAASMFLRHFDVALADQGQAGNADGRVDGRTLWVSPGLVAGWLSRHQAARERRVNGWMRLTEAAQAFLVQLVLTAMRGKPLVEEDLLALSEAVSTTPLGSRLQLEMKRLYHIQVATPPAFYSMGEPGSVLTVMREIGKPLPEPWRFLLEPAWEALGWGGTMDARKLPGAFPSQDATVADRARLVLFSLTLPQAPAIGPETTDTDISNGFLQAIAPLLTLRPLPPPFLFENLAHGYLAALRQAAGSHPPRALFDPAHRPNPTVRFGCVMAAVDQVGAVTEATDAYEAALLAGLCNLDRQE